MTDIQTTAPDPMIVELERTDSGWLASCPSCPKAVEAVDRRAARLSVEAHAATWHGDPEACSDCGAVGGEHQAWCP